MAGYTRQASSTIINGSVIDADDFTSEYNAVENAFNANISTGHKHDGSAGEGAPITKVGPNQDLIFETLRLLPKTTNTLDLGTALVQFKNAWFDGTVDTDALIVLDNATVGGTLGVTGVLTATGGVSGNITGNVTGALTGNVTGNVTGDVTGDVTGALTGNVTGNVTGALTGNVTGNITGNVTGDVTGALTGNADTATAWVTARDITLTGDVTGTVSGVNGGGNISIATTVAANSVALGTDTTGDYVSSLVAGTGVTLTNNSGETSTPTLAIGQAVSTTSDVTFNDLVVSGDLTVSGTTTTINTETLSLADNQIILNSNEAGTPSQNGGIEIERGTEANKTLVWNEADDKWTVGSETFVASTFEGALTGNASSATTAAALTGNITTTGSTTVTKGSSSISFNPEYTNDFSGTSYTSSLIDASKLTLSSSGGKMLFIADIYEKVAKFDFQGGYYNTISGSTSGADQSVVQLKLTRRDEFTASNEKIGFIEFDGADSAGSMETYVSIEGHIATNSANNQDGKLILATARNGTFFSNYSADGHADKVELGKFKYLDLMSGAAGSVKVWTGNGSTTLNSTFSGTDLTVVGTVNATTVDLGNWTVTESAGTLFFATGGTNKMKLDASGNLTVVGTVTPSGTM